MLQQLPRELVHARELMDEAKLDEALEIVENFEKDKSLSPEDQLSVLLIKGRIYRYKYLIEESIKMGEEAYLLSQKLGKMADSIDALFLKSQDPDSDKALEFAFEAEELIDFLESKSSLNLTRQRADILLIKSWIYLDKTDYEKALETALVCLGLRKNIGNKLDLTSTYFVLGWINVNQVNRTRAFEYAKKSMDCNKEMNYNFALSDDYFLIAYIYSLEGEYDKALQYCIQSTSFKEISVQVKLNVLNLMGWIYLMKSEINQALHCFHQIDSLAEESNNRYLLVFNLNNLAYVYRMIGKTSLTIEYVKRGLILCKEGEFNEQMARGLAIIIITYLDENSQEKAKLYFTRLTELYNQTKQKEGIDISYWYYGSKAFILKTSTRMRDRVEAQSLLKELLDKELIERTHRSDIILMISNYCDLLLEELSIYNDPEILEEINALIIKSNEIAKKAGNYSFLAETKLLQAKLALIQLNTEDAQKLMLQAQRIADSHGLNLLAWGISSELDKLLEQIEVWDRTELEETAIGERIKLASTNKVLERIQGKRIIEPPKLVDEEPILLLIMSKAGNTYFNHTFIKNWDYSDLFSSFMSAFNTFSSEIFSKSIDRIRIGENTILINPVEPFLTCYVIKGQSYPALQKLTRFSEAIIEKPEIWQALNKSVQTSEMLELDKPPSLKTVIDEIF
jgi:tetratricopeptide (TPR) repeat protein